MDESDSQKPGLLERLSTLLLREPEDREQLIQLLHSAHERNLLDDEALTMMEGAIRISERRVREIMVPRMQMDVIDISQPPEKFIQFVLETARSRFPVVDGDRDNIIGILLAKDLLRYYSGLSHDIREMLRPAVFVPETKRLNELLNDLRNNRNHMVLVADEYGGVSGMVTIEDVLEEIVGNIEDEYDLNEDEPGIVPDEDGSFRVKAHTSIDEFNHKLNVSYSNNECDTVGGLVLHAARRLPQSGEQFTIGELLFTVVNADDRKVCELQVQRKPNDLLPEQS